MLLLHQSNIPKHRNIAREIRISKIAKSRKLHIISKVKIHNHKTEKIVKI